MQGIAFPQKIGHPSIFVTFSSQTLFIISASNSWAFILDVTCNEFEFSPYTFIFPSIFKCMRLNAGRVGLLMTETFSN